MITRLFPVKTMLLSSGLIIGALGSGCGKGLLLEFSEIRKSPDLKAMEKFVESHSFQSDRTPNIYFVFFDTLRPDYALAQKGPMKSFYNKSLTFDKAYGSGTATWYSMYTMFHSSPGFLAYDAVPTVRDNTNEYGSVFLKVLHKLGYKIDVYGYDWRCDVEERPSGTSWKRFLMTFLGWKSRLLNRCQSDPQYDDRYDVNRDEFLVDDLYKKLPTVVTGPNKHLSFIMFYNNHSPYKWGAADKGISKNVGDREDFSNIRMTINRYSNSVVASEINFDRTLKLIQTLPGNENAIIVFFSDHGEALYEKYRESGHGGRPFREKIETLLAFKFPEEPSLAAKKYESSIASIADIFPTVFDYMGIMPQVPSELIVGRSLLEQSRSSTIGIKSNMNDPTREMVLINQSHKAWIEVDESDFYHSKSFRLKRITNLDDRKVENFCEKKTPDQCKIEIITRFPEAIKELYPAVELPATVQKAPSKLSRSISNSKTNTKLKNRKPGLK